MAKNTQIDVLNSPAMSKIRNNLLPQLSRNRDLLLAMGVLLILGLLIIPLPPKLLDIFLATNITLSVLILMIAIYIRTPL
ncbi:MAG TPA: FHIPEP family type III secretion protein, partial [Candidatus Kapabacteria bacterium]|nr:FHIPEP family type III secretion protein [Candidatus Kapabacteria bacterium]